MSMSMLLYVVSARPHPRLNTSTHLVSSTLLHQPPPTEASCTQRQGSHKQIASLHGRGGPATTILKTWLSKVHNKIEQKAIR